MKKSLYIPFLLITLSWVMICTAQDNNEKLTNGTKADTSQVTRLLEKAGAYFFMKPDSCLLLSQESIELSRQLHYKKGELEGLNMAGEAFRFLGEFPQALEAQFNALEISRAIHNKRNEAITMNFIGFTYIELKEFRQALSYLFDAQKILDTIHTSPSDLVNRAFNLSNIGGAYLGMKMLDSALYYQDKALARSVDIKHIPLKGLILGRFGMTYAQSGDHERALQFYRQALNNGTALPSIMQNKIAESYFALNQFDSSYHYGSLAYRNAQQGFLKKEILEACNTLVKLFRIKNQPDSVIYYQDMAIAMNDSLFGPGKHRQLQLLALRQQQGQQAILQEKERFKNQTRTVALLAGLGVFAVIAFILFRNNRNKQKLNKVLEGQKREIQQTLEELQATQSQLIQSEKMASLGQLTAGIAHEIQNPLNFINNFSEVNTELIDELEQEVNKGNLEATKLLTKDIKENEQKINHHGKRADAIVKGMLQHSRSSSSVKEPTDINALADEYLRLAYHGLRARDKTFNATMKTDFDPSAVKINIVPQDIGRVVLNLITNAFYAVTEKKKQSTAGYEPMVIVGTRKINDKLEIRVGDNGNGIPPKVLDKIFQPFFTTKPTGQGTGLGLSLSYDIVKAHGGELKVTTTEGKGSEFILVLPAN